MALGVRCSPVGITLCGRERACTDHIIDWVSAFTADDEFVGAVDSFISKHASEFQDSKDESAGGVSSGEFSLVYVALPTRSRQTPRITVASAGTLSCTTSSLR